MGSHLGVVLSGRGYGPQGPVLHYPRLVLQQLGADVRVVSNPETDEQLSEDAQWQQFLTGVGSQVAGFIDEVRPDRVTFVAKSLGTIALANIELNVPESTGRVEAVWLTPLFGRSDVRDGAVAKNWRSLIVAGQADPYHDAHSHAVVAAALGADSMVLDGADHSLEIAGDVQATLQVHTRFVERTLEFLAT